MQRHSGQTQVYPVTSTTNSYLRNMVPGTSTQTTLYLYGNRAVQCKIVTDLGLASSLITKDDEALLYTGIPKDKFEGLVKAMETVAKTENVTFTLPLADQILLTLMKLRLNLLLEDLAKRFSISISQVSRVSSFWIRNLALHLSHLIVWLPRETIRVTLPDSFKCNYPKTTCIIDCAETFMQKALNLDSRGETYSQYKSHNTVKYLVAIAPSGQIMFVSAAYSGRASDKFIVQDSNFLKYLLPGDEVMADRGFTIEDWVFERHAKLSIPAFTHGGQLSEDAVTSTRRLASVRIHAERAIRRMKVFKILRDVIPVNMANNFNCILRICAALVNLRGDLIKDDNIDTLFDAEDGLEKTELNA